MSATHDLQGDQVYRVLADRQAHELRFRSAMITSTACHTGLAFAVLLAPLLIPAPQLFDFTPVNVVQMEAPPPQPAPPPETEQPAAEEPEPPEIEPPSPEDVPEDLEAQRRKEAEEDARRREEERQRRERDEARRAAEEAERRREEEAERRRQPQQATRRAPAPQQALAATQQAARGEVGMQLEPGMTEQDLRYLQFWINRVLTNIGNKWEQHARPTGSREAVAVVHFRVGRDGGFLIQPEVRTGSGDRRYDDAALRAARAGQPFPPLPQAYRGTTLAINLAFRQ